MSATRESEVNLGARQTWWALLAAAVAILPLSMLFTDSGWLVDAWIGMALVIVPAALLRLRYRPNAAQLLPGVVLAVLWLTWHFTGSGPVPSGQTWDAVQVLWREVQDTVHKSSAPLPSTPAVRFGLSVALIVLALVVDLLAVVLAVPALAGVPFLLVFTLSGAVPRQSVHWWLFLATAVAFLILLSLHSGTETARWGRLIRRPGRSAGRSAVLSISGRRIAVIALAVGVLLPFVVPVNGRNAISAALHNGNGSGGNGRVSLTPLAALRGDLTLSTPRTLFDVSVTPGTEPYYLEQAVLDTYSGGAWRAGDDPGPDVPASSGDFTARPFGQVTTQRSQYNASITVRSFDGVAPVFGDPSGLDGLGSATWDQGRSVLASGTVGSGGGYSEQVSAPDPSVAELRSADDSGQDLSRWLELPTLTPQVTQQVSTLTAGVSGQYAKALAIYRYFTPANGFSYSLTTQPGSSGDDLTDFLTNKVGFCQQYAGAMGVMLRAAGVPARVVIGFTHQAPDRSGHFTVTTRDAHAWVEAYFGGVGWIPFDPTPLSGTDGQRAVTTPWAGRNGVQATTAPSASTAPKSSAPVPSRSVPSESQPSTAPVATTDSSGGGIPAWLWQTVLGVALALALAGLPALLRARRRRSRIGLTARSGRTDPLWDELADTATDLGYVWSDSRSPRQVTQWLGEAGLSDPARESLANLAGSVERSRYGRGRTGVLEPEAPGWLAQVEHELRDRRGAGARLRARLLPVSLRRRH